MFFRYDGAVQDPTGLAIPGADVAVLSQPASFATQPGSPLEPLYAADASNAATIVGASWSGGQITFTFSTTPPADVVPGSFIGIAGALPAGYNTTLSAPFLVVEVDGDNVIVADLANPGTYVSGGTVASSVLPNPTATDNNGNYFFYAAAGIYSIQIYSPVVAERDLPDQGVGTVAGGSVTSAALTMPADFSVAGSPITTNGDFVVTWADETANTFLSGPTGGSAAPPTWRNITAADLTAGGISFGTVNSVALALSMPAIFSVAISGSPVTSTGTLTGTVTLATQNANFVWAGPASGAASSPAFRALVVDDIPVSGYTSLQSELFAGPLQDLATNLSGTTDAIVFPGSNFITHAGVDATTLATPVAGGPGVGDDGKIVRIWDTTGHAQTVTTASNKIVPSHSIITFNGTAGSFAELEAFGGLWYVGPTSGVSIT